MTAEAHPRAVAQTPARTTATSINAHRQAMQYVDLAVVLLAIVVALALGFGYR